MRPNAAPRAVPDGPVRVEFQVQFSRGPKGRRRLSGGASQKPSTSAGSEGVAPAASEMTKGNAPRPAPVPENIPRITRLLVLGHHFERLIRDGVVKDYAEIARLTGLSRARVTQIVNLTLLTPKIQEVIVHLTSNSPGAETTFAAKVRLVGLPAAWAEQSSRWKRGAQLGHPGYQ